MEFSMQLFAQSLQTSDLDAHFKIYSNCPSADDVNPGIAQIVSMHHTFVRMNGKSNYTIEKKQELNDVIQDGSGENGNEDMDNSADHKMEPKILNSMNHPRILTEKVSFPKVKEPKRKVLTGEGVAAKRLKIKHSFKVE